MHDGQESEGKYALSGGCIRQRTGVGSWAVIKRMNSVWQAIQTVKILKAFTVQ